MTKQVRLTQQAYIEGYDAAELRIINRDGTASPDVIRGNWYTAEATDSAGNAYAVYWALLDGHDTNSGDEGDACNWDNPIMVIDEDGRNVAGEVVIIR